MSTKVVNNMIRWLNDTPEDSNINELMFIIKPDVVKRLEIINMISYNHAILDTDDIFDDLSIKLKNCFVDDVTYDSFISGIALIQYYLNLLKDNDNTPDYIDKLTLEVANTLSHLEIDPYKTLYKLTNNRKHCVLRDLELSFILGVVTGMLTNMIIHYYL